MGLFKKKEEKKVYLPTSENRDAESEAAKLKALEASLEFLNNPKTKEENKKKTEETKDSEESADTEEQAGNIAENPEEIKAEEDTPKAKLTKETTLTSAVKANPVAPAVQPPSGKTLNPNAANQNVEEKKSDSAPMPKPQETEEEKTSIPMTSMASKQWGRRMDYKTAVVKPKTPAQEVQPPTKPLAPTSVSNVPPAPRMPSNSLHTLNSQNKLTQQQQNGPQQNAPQVPARTIVPKVPEIPGKTEKNDKPTIATMNTPVPAQADPAPTIVASSTDNTAIPRAQNTAQKPEAAQVPKPAPADIPVKAPLVSDKTPETDVKKPEPAVKAEPIPAGVPSGMQRAMPITPVQNTKNAEEKGLKAGNTGLIPNPLPTPKKHIPKEMDFDIQPPATQMHFDIVDMTGMDFFDIN